MPSGVPRFTGFGSTISTGMPRVSAVRSAIAVMFTEKLVPMNTMRAASAIHRSAVPMRYRSV